MKQSAGVSVKSQFKASASSAYMTTATYFPVRYDKL